MKHTLFVINPSYSYEQALRELESHGLKHPYSIEESSSPDKIGGFFDTLPPSLLYSTLIDHSEGVDWDKEWKTHSPYYKEGLLEIDLNDFEANLTDSKIYLEPGPGFGDLSHPTTYLMLKTIAKHVKDKPVIDIGCGSGILSLAAHKMGAANVIGIDIEDEALAHSRKNALLNKMESLKFLKVLNDNQLNQENLIFLINMTFFEQKEVFSLYPDLKGTFIISGILNNQKINYLKTFPYTRNSPLAVYEKDAWLSILLSN